MDYVKVVKNTQKIPKKYPKNTPLFGGHFQGSFFDQKYPPKYPPFLGCFLGSFWGGHFWSKKTCFFVFSVKVVFYNKSTVGYYKPKTLDNRYLIKKTCFRVNFDHQRTGIKSGFTTQNIYNRAAPLTNEKIFPNQGNTTNLGGYLLKNPEISLGNFR